MDFVSKVDSDIIVFYEFTNNFEAFDMSVARIIYIIFLETCVDTNKDAVDKSGMDCKGYEFWNLCSQSDKGKDENFEAKTMCCTCGGGSVPKGKLAS